MSYDWLEDPWLMEGTAAWIEDEVYDDINDNWQYLSTSALVNPSIPVDYGAGGHKYGAWVFWRFLAEYFGTQTRATPDVIREVWELADGADGAPNMHSLDAVRALSAREGTSFTRLFADFAAIGHISKEWYFEGAHYPRAPIDRTFRFSRSRPSTGGWWWGRQDHLTSSSVQFAARASLRGHLRLRIAIDAPTRRRGSAATIAVHRRSGSISWRDVSLSAAGNAVLTLPFTRAEVRRVVLTMTNASTRMDCWQGAPFSCRGVSRDDGVRFYFKAKVVR